MLQHYYRASNRTYAVELFLGMAKALLDPLAEPNRIESLKIEILLIVNDLSGDRDHQLYRIFTVYALYMDLTLLPFFKLSISHC
jgi:hypothetical protein